ncbi:hypothetical protein [Methylocystis suflitae]|uniref:hypothetical protein n=1 Tax=Methylocystis suflitae TaxID=2951405 RepID=UPI00210B257D|nr:hypothetical protein [Methylocystis suflitae]MCQ4188581.1 hypothetical protein [Methylocystis suflitae]
MALFKKKSAPNALAQLENALSTTKRKRDDLVGRRDRLACQLAEAEEARKAALLLDDDDESNAALTKAASNCESLRSSLQGVDLVLAEHDAKIADLEIEIKTGQDRAAREAEAARQEEKQNRTRDAFPKYLDAARELSEALGGTGHFHLEEASALIARVARDVETARPMLLQWGDHAIAELRADPPPQPAPAPAQEQLGQPSPFRRKFAASDGGAIGDRAPDRQYFGGFAERT